MDDKELTAMQTVLSALEGLEEDAKKRVIEWAAGRLGIAAVRSGAGSTLPVPYLQKPHIDALQGFATFAEFFHALSPNTNSMKALAAAYWLQVYGQQEQYTGQAVNKELQELGHSINNVTQAFSALKDRKPAFAIQLRKSGKHQQARKLYKLTRAGLEAVNSMLQGNVLE